MTVWAALLAALAGCASDDVDDAHMRDTGRTEDAPAGPDDSGGRDSSHVEPIPAGARIWDGATVVDADGAREHRAILVVGDRVWDEREAGGPWPADAEVVDAAGRWIVPGLVDGHVHLAHAGSTVWTGDGLDANLRASLYHGVTAVFDVGGPTSLLELRDRAEAGEVLAPRIRATGPFLTAERSHPCETWPDPDLCVFVGDAETASDAAAALRDAGADAVKVALADAAFTPWPTPRLDLEALAAITAGGLPVVAHVDADADVIDAVRLGAAILAHPPFAGPVGPEARDAACEADAVLSTVGAFAAVGRLLDGARDLDDPALIVGPGVRDNWRYVRARPEVLTDGWAEASAEWAASARANLVTLRAAGATVVPGSDAGYYFQPHGLGLHEELTALQDLGWAPLEVLTAATLTARERLGFEGGRVRPGAPADLLVLREDPTLDVSALRAIDTVVLRGIPWARETLRTTDLQTSGEPCLEADDCAADDTCDALTRTCAPGCAPTFDRVGDCGPHAWCMPVDGVDATEGVCHPEDACDLYTQDCAPAAYGQACVPVDVDTNRCWYGGPRGAGEACSWIDAGAACAPGLFCSWIDATCYTLCDPEVPDTCDGPQRCVRQLAAPGVPWFGLCL